MKTAISLPDATFEQASERAADLGMSRSEFVTRAVRRYLDQLDADSVTEQINSALERIGTRDDSSSVAVAAGRARLDGAGDDW